MVLKVTLLSIEIVLVTLFGQLAYASDNVLVFPGAEGFGAYARGGRGGKVLFVTNLQDYDPQKEKPIPGTLRAAVDAAGRRIVLFRTSGTIRLKAPLVIAKPYITIAGQTAPGDGICISNATVRIGSSGRPTHDVVLRYLRIRTGDSGPDKAPDSLAINNAYRVIVDHCSISWGVDEVLSITAHPLTPAGRPLGKTYDVTVQWCIVSEGLHNSTHPKGKHSKCILLAYGATRTTLHHNLMMHCHDRSPASGGPDGHTFIHQVVNNIVYNWGENAGIDGYASFDYKNPLGKINFVGNYYIMGPDSKKRRCLFLGMDDCVYAHGNIGAYRTSLDQDEFRAIKWHSPCKREGIKATEPFDAPEITTHSYLDAYELVLANAGAMLPNRDAVDQRLIKDVQMRKGRIIDHPSDVGGWPQLKSVLAPKDIDEDGMPDEWEVKYGLNPKRPFDSARDKDKDGYTNIEEFLNGTNPNVKDID